MRINDVSVIVDRVHVCLFRVICKFTQFQIGAAQIRIAKLQTNFEIAQPSLHNFKIEQPSIHDFEIALRKLEIAKLHCES